MSPTHNIVHLCVHLGPIEIPTNVSPHRRVLIEKLNDVARNYAEKEFKFINEGCKPEDRLHMETSKNFWLGLQAAFKESSLSNNRKVKEPITKDLTFRQKSFDYTCTKCQKVFLSTNHFNIQRHLESHEKTEKCKSVVTKADSAGSVKAKKMEKKVFDYTCDVCGKHFENMNTYNLKRHLEWHERSKEGLTRSRKANYKCRSCKKYFEEIDHLANHQCKTLRKEKQTGTQENIKIIHKNKSLLNKISRGKYIFTMHKISMQYI